MRVARHLTRLRRFKSFGHGSKLFCAQAFESASEALRKVAVGGPDVGEACQEFLSARASLEQSGLGPAWLQQQATGEEEEQLELLNQELPRGRRVAPGLLDSFVAARPSPTEATARNLVAAMGARDGLAQVMDLRASVRAGIRREQFSTAGFALVRLDKRLERLLSDWLNPGLLHVESITAASPGDVLEAAAAVADSVFPGAGRNIEELLQSHRCFALTLPQMACDLKQGGAPPLLVAFASLRCQLPNTLEEAVAVSDSEQEATVSPSAACLWALDFPSSLQAEALQGMDLRPLLRKQATNLLRTEVSSSSDPNVAALVPLRGFRAWLQDARPWLQRGLGQTVEESLQAAAQGVAGAQTTELVFTDADGDTVELRLCRNTGTLQAVMPQQAPQHVKRLKIADRALLLLLETGAMQVNLPENLDLVQLEKLGEAAGLLGAELRNAVLRLAYEYVLLRDPSGSRAADPEVHFHLQAGADLRALHWRADESQRGILESLGVMASFNYGSAVEEETRGKRYRELGIAALSQA